MEHFKKYGKFLTPELKDQLGVPLQVPKGSTITQEQLDDHVILGALILGYGATDPQKELFLEVMEQLADTLTAWATTEDNGLDDNNSIPIVRGAHLSRERIGIFDQTSEAFIAYLVKEGHWTTNHLDDSYVADLHPFVRFLYLMEAHENAIVKLEESFAEPGITTANRVVFDALQQQVIPDLFQHPIKFHNTGTIVVNVVHRYTDPSGEEICDVGSVVVDRKRHCETYISK